MGNKEIDQRIVRMLRSSNGNARMYAEQITLKRTLENLNLITWLKYNLDYQILFQKVLPDPKDALIASVSLGKDKGALMVYTAKNSHYVPAAPITGLVPITSINTVAIPGLDYKALIIEEYLDELTGGLFEVKTKSIFLFNNSGFTKVWERDSYWKEMRPEGDVLKGAQTRWLLEEETVDIRISPQGVIEASGLVTYSKAKTLGDISGEYVKTGSIVIREIYNWDKKHFKFRKVTNQ